MLSIDELLTAAYSIRPVLSDLLDADTARQVDEQLATLLGQLDSPEPNLRSVAQGVRTLLQAHPPTKAWLEEFATTHTTTRSAKGVNSFEGLPGSPALQRATAYRCPVCGHTEYQEVNEAVPLCPIHLVSLVRA
ncbi:MAG: hypothetical protein KME20_09695 [Kaiparowitsia implicata GSE-PSE-MK54-09C]|jgi:rubrerythrin|nr:hypothetical protein [Kaiparowitsia implicata GSE-PSE-MK54-09C]